MKHAVSRIVLFLYPGSCADSSDQCALLKDVFCAPGNVDGQNVCPQTCGLCRKKHYTINIK